MKRLFQQRAGHRGVVLLASNKWKSGWQLWREKKRGESNQTGVKWWGAKLSRKVKSELKVWISLGVYAQPANPSSDSGLMGHVLVHGLFVEQIRRSYVFHNSQGGEFVPQGLKETSWITDDRKAGKLFLLQKRQQNINAFSSTMNLKVTKLSP